MTKLPYDFDLLFDIKSVEELHRILLEENLEYMFIQEDLEELMKVYNIPYPEGYNQLKKPGFPKIVWIDNNGGYLTYAPEESDKYQRMRAF